MRLAEDSVPRSQEDIEQKRWLLRHGAGPEVGPLDLSGHLEHELAIDDEALEDDDAGPVHPLASYLSALQNPRGLEGQSVCPRTQVKVKGFTFGLLDGGSAIAGTVPRSVTAAIAEKTAIRTSFTAAPRSNHR